MDGWMDGRESGVKDCLQQSKITSIKTQNLNCTVTPVPPLGRPCLWIRLHKKDLVVFGKHMFVLLSGDYT
jgi:hypothetical protein